MISGLANLAIQSALGHDWPEAVRTNQELLQADPENIEALNRLAHAYKETGEIHLAQKTYRKVLKIDRFNPIANKNLKLLLNSPKHRKQKTDGPYPSPTPQIFLEEPGKTKIVTLINPASAAALLSVSCGSQVNLLVKRRTTTVADLTGTYLGALPDDLSARLIKTIKMGNRYEVFVKTVAKNYLTVFIREFYRSPRLKNQPSFPVNLCVSNFPLSEEGPSEADAAEESPAEEESLPVEA